MALVIPNTATQDNYVSATTFAGTDVLAHGYFLVANAGVFARLLHGIHGQARPGEEGFFPPGIYPLKGGNRPDPIAGIQFRSAVAGTPAQVSGVIYYPGEASIGQGTQFQSTVGGGGTVTPPPTLEGFKTARVARTTNFNVPDGFVPNSVTWEAEDYDTDTFFDLAQPTRLTCQRAGIVWVWGIFNITVSVAGDFSVSMSKNGVGGPDVSLGANGNYNPSIPGFLGDVCVAGDYFEMRIAQKTGAVRIFDATGSKFGIMLWPT